jgi:hypothetical protein
MICIPKVVGLTSCCFLLCLGLSNAAQAANADSAEDALKAEQSDRRQGGQEAGEKQITNEMKDGLSQQGGRTIEGEVLRVEGDNCFVKGQDGKEVRVHFDETTENPGNIKAGDRIEAKVNDQNHALSMRSPDRRNDRTPDSTPDSGQTGSTGQ